MIKRKKKRNVNRRARGTIERSTEEFDFMDALKLHLGANPMLRWWRQNSGVIPVRNQAGTVERYFHAGPPKGAADMSGIVMPEGWRLEVELKSSKGERSPQQIAWGDFIIVAGGVYALIAYDPLLSMHDNCVEAERIVLAAIERRRAA